MSIFSLNKWPLVGPASDDPGDVFKTYMTYTSTQGKWDRLETGSLEDLGARPSQATPFRSYHSVNQTQVRLGKETDAGGPWPVMLVQPIGNGALNTDFLHQ